MSAATGWTCQKPSAGTVQSRPAATSRTTGPATEPATGPATGPAVEPGSRRSSETQTPSGRTRGSPFAGATARIDVASGQSVVVTGSSCTAGWAMRQRSTGTTWCVRWRNSPARSDPSTAYRTRVRQPSGPPGNGRTRTSTSGRPARRASCSRTTDAFQASCACTEACCRSQPPHRPGRAHGHGGSTRSADGTRISTASARRKPRCTSVISATTSSPGSACRTKTTRPPGPPIRATQ